ncbi:MAG: HNH endonuclease [Pseudomonadota bacterium]
MKIGKSTRSAKSYSGAVSGVISTWAMDAGLTDGSLMEIQSARQYSQLVNKIKNIEIFQTRNTKGNGMYSSALNAYADYLADITAEDIQEDITDLLDDPAIDKTEQAMLVNARVGQGKFRQLLIDQWQGCALTGFSDSRFLVASHIRPWRDSSNQERPDPFNGLLLQPNLDKVFDLGYITFAVGGDIMISKELENTVLLGVKPDMAIKLGDGHRKYMEYHREVVFGKRFG